MPDPTSPPVTTSLTLPDIRVPAAWTLGGLVAGLALGLALAQIATPRPVTTPVVAVAGPVGALWLRALQMTILPLVVAMLVGSIARAVDAARAGAMARRTLSGFLVIYTASAALAAVIVPPLLRVFPIPARAIAALHSQTAPGPVPTAADFLLSLLPDNIFAALANGAILPVIVFTALFGVALTRIDVGQRWALVGLFDAVASAAMVMIGWVLALAPLGVFALGLNLAAHSGFAALGVLAHYVAVVSAAGLPVLMGAWLLAVSGGRLAPGRYAAAMMPVCAVALATQSSLASLPAMLAACRRLGISQVSADFVLPLSVALLRATGPAMNLAVAIYIAGLTGVPITPASLVAGALVAALTEVSSPSLPGAISLVSAVGPVALAMGVPLAPLGLLVAVDMLPDLMRTLGNVSMDVALAAVIGRKPLAPLGD